MSKLYTRRESRKAHADSNMPRVKPGGYLEHIDRGDGKTLCAFHRDTYALTSVPREQVHRKCPRCIHLNEKEKANGTEATRSHR